MSCRSFDFVIFGQGLAGTTLAWTLLGRGASVLVVDAEFPGSASRVAAGLMTPITGPRLAKAWGWDESWTTAIDFFRGMESQLGVSLLTLSPAVRLLSSAAEVAVLRERLGDPHYAGLITSPAQVSEEAFHSPFGAWEMPAARLDVPTYLQASREHFLSLGVYRTAACDPHTDLIVEEQRVVVRPLEVTAGRVILCQGFFAARQSHSAIPFNPARGEILTIEVPGLEEQRTVHQQVWLAPQRTPGEYRVGATFDWSDLNEVPTLAGREELLSRLRSFLKLPVRVLDQQAAVRPTMRDFRPALGAPSGSSRMFLFNGLGTRGALLAPRLSGQLADHLLAGIPLSPEVDASRWSR